jgi:hypothetical protein
MKGNTKRTAAVVIAALVVLSLATVAVAAEMMQKGTIKGVDSKAGTITFCPEGSNMDMVLKADKGVDLSVVKPNTKAEISVEKDRLKSIKELRRPKAPVGC